MRALVFCTLLAVSTGCALRPCKKGTVLMTLQLDSSSTTVDSFDIAMSTDNGAAQHVTIGRKPGTNQGTVEIDFAQGYTPGASLTVAVRGLNNGMTVAFGMATQALPAGCATMLVNVTGGGDGGIVKRVGEPAEPGDNCETGHIIDGYCCDSACEGQCEACDVVPGMCQPVAGVPHGMRTACSGAGVQPPCGPETCDGVTTGSCTWPTASCGQASCTAGVATAVGMCGGGMCQPGATRSCPGGICGATDCATVTQIATGDAHTCALLSDATVRCWGANAYGQLGLGDNNVTDAHVPTMVPGLSNVAQVVAGYEHTCALLKDGTVQCWGGNVHGALGRGTYDNLDPIVSHGSPQPVLSAAGGAPFGGVTQIAASNTAQHTCAILTNGQTWCWGDNSFGQIGNGTSVSGNDGQKVPTPVCATGTGCTSGLALGYVSVGGQETCGVDAQGSNNVCWGSNISGEVGISPSDFNAHPNPVAAHYGTKPAVGAGTVCVLQPDGTGRVRCWGSNVNGMLGTGGTGGGASPLYVCVNANCQSSVTDQLDNVSEVSVGGAVCVVRLGAAKCWGPNDQGQLGDGTTVSSLSLATSTAIAANVSAVSVGGAHVCALLTDGTVQCWGKDANGQLGDNDSAGLIKRTPVTPHW